MHSPFFFEKQQFQQMIILGVLKERCFLCIKNTRKLGGFHSPERQAPEVAGRLPQLPHHSSPEEMQEADFWDGLGWRLVGNSWGFPYELVSIWLKGIVWWL